MNNSYLIIRRLAIYASFTLMLCIFCQGCRHPTAYAGEDMCLTNLNRLGLLLSYATAESNPLFPKTLKDLDNASVPKPIDPSLFVSPATGGKPGPMSKVDEWTDFIYIGNMGDSVLSAALIISPPENH